MNSPFYPKHYCGVFGIQGSPKAAEHTFGGLYALQHRGQESAGIVTTDGQQFFSHKAMGLVRSIFTPEILTTLKGESALGHTRYSTTGSSALLNAQPLVIDCKFGNLALAHNGNLTNSSRLRHELTAKGVGFQTTTDSEIVLNLIASSPSTFDKALLAMMDIIEGAYSLVLMTTEVLIGIRDPHGFHPLSIGKLGDAFVLASETCAFDNIGAKFLRDVEPGEIVLIENGVLRTLEACTSKVPRAFCVFEHVYFARPDSMLNGKSVYSRRVTMGRMLAKRHPIEADVVVPIPDGGNIAALGYSRESGIPFEMALVRNHYVQRTFIEPSQQGRESSVGHKLNLIPELVRGKRVVVVDDSIVRGTTCRARVRRLKEAGAREVHMRISCPPHMHPCHYGINFPDPSELMAVNNTLEEIRGSLGLDSLGYLTEEDLVEAVGGNGGLCMACYNGKYPVTPDIYP